MRLLLERFVEVRQASAPSLPVLLVGTLRPVARTWWPLLAVVVGVLLVVSIIEATRESPSNAVQSSVLPMPALPEHASSATDLCWKLASIQEVRVDSCTWLGHIHRMRNGRSGWRALGAAIQLGVALHACAEAGTKPGGSPASTPPEDTAHPADNGQTGSTEPPICFPGVPMQPTDEGPCGVHLEEWTRPIGRAELVQATCTHEWSFETLALQPLVFEQQPFCECLLRRTRLPGDDRPWPEGTDEVANYPGFQSLSCSVRGRTPSSCLYCGSDFPGCSVDDPHSCDAACAELAGRYDADLQQAYSATLRRLSCGDDYSCEFVTEIGGLCYANNPILTDLPPLDCALSDEQLLERKGERSTTCLERPAVECTTASECPRGLACNDADRCVGCYEGCYETGLGGCARCADGEVCIAALCVPQSNAECTTFLDCGQGSQCVLSGVDLTGGRGNARTRSQCQMYPSD